MPRAPAKSPPSSEAGVRGTSLPKITVTETKRVPIGKLKPYPGNARRGDVDAIVESIEAHGQYKPLIVSKRTMTVLIGNHTMRALQRLGAKDALCSFVNVDKDEEREISPTSTTPRADRASQDDRALSRLLQASRRTDAGLAGTGYSDKFADRLLASIRNQRQASIDQSDLIEENYKVIVACKDERSQTELIDRLIAEGFQVKALVS